jgi:hypothetical protein
MNQKQFHDFTTVKDRVRFLLQTNPSLRDNDMKLIANYYFHEIGKDDIHNLNAYELLAKISNAKTTNFETIRRWRTKLQYYDESLRGSAYKKKREKNNPAFKVFLR